MRRIVESGLVITLTIISVFAMVTVKGVYIQDEPVFLEEDKDDYGKPEGTGYLFEDFDKEINIPFEGQEEIEKDNKENESSQLEKENFKRMLKRNMAKLDEEEKSSGVFNKSNTLTYNTNNIRSESKVIITKVQNNISFEDKLSLLKIVKNLNLKDLNDIRNAIFNGTTNAESIKLWTMLRNKLPYEEYKKLENIIAKYE